jgi:hypothetical protein
MKLGIGAVMMNTMLKWTKNFAEGLSQTRKRRGFFTPKIVAEDCPLLP